MDDTLDMLLRLLLRLLVVPLGYIAGMLASLTIVVIGYWQLGHLLAQASELELFAILDALMAAVLLLVALVFTMWLVASIGILFAEAFALRGWMFHVGNGLISAWLAGELFTPINAVPLPFDDSFYMTAAGLAGGLCYWLVAGWSAGFWKPLRPRPPALPYPPQRNVTGA
ncbi:MAG TPA: hypothetical protein VLA00_05455 [Xanthobacteraceae bacterium]|nr:hypothetical protein [Xanthobacteraceae bacterium]